MKKLFNQVSPFLPDFNNIENSMLVCDSESLKWYKKLSIHQRINLKEICPLIIGVGFSDLDFIFSMRKRIDIIYSKLAMEGIICDGDI